MGLGKNMRKRLMVSGIIYGTRGEGNGTERQEGLPELSWGCSWVQKVQGLDTILFHQCVVRLGVVRNSTVVLQVGSSQYHAVSACFWVGDAR